MQFKLTIQTWNDAMRTASDVADALETIAAKIRDTGDDGTYTVRDLNGNTIGSYELVQDKA